MFHGEKATFMRRNGFEAALTDVKNRVHDAIDEAKVETARDTLKLLVYFSSGTVTAAKLAQPPPGLNRPYGWGTSNRLGLRGPIPYGDAAIINAQTGVFRASWRLEIENHFGSIKVRIRNIASYARYLEEGTDVMIPRPLEDVALDYIARTFPLRMDERLYRAEVDSSLLSSTRRRPALGTLN